MGFTVSVAALEVWAAHGAAPFTMARYWLPLMLTGGAVMVSIGSGSTTVYAAIGYIESSWYLHWCSLPLVAVRTRAGSYCHTKVATLSVHTVWLAGNCALSTVGWLTVTVTVLAGGTWSNTQIKTD